MSQRAATTGSSSFDPATLFSTGPLLDSVRQNLNGNDLQAAIVLGFSLKPNDNYIYHATASVTLDQVQKAINAGAAHGLHDWYLDDNGTSAGHPSTADIAAYIALFDPSKFPTNSLKGFTSNAKKSSLRASIAQHLTSKRFVHAILPPIPRRKQPHSNPYIDFWSWSCHSLEYAGPNTNTANVKTSHHVLPIFMHHFGCVCPSYEALATIATLAKGKTVIDAGSGNGYWTYILRTQHDCDVIAVDSGQSQWRTAWINDTVITDGIQFMKERQSVDDVLLMVYPIVSDSFTERAVKAFKGSVICIAATQNGSGYSGFKDEKVDMWFEREMKGWERIAQIPLPSFAGKDDALFVFRKTET